MGNLAIHDTAASSSTRDGSYVDWPCTMAGAVTAAAISFVLLTFGSGVGLSIVSPRSGSGLSMVTFAVLTSLWFLGAQLSAFAAGGYLAGRMRRPWKDAKVEEVEFRDGVHGALVWAVGVAFGAFLFVSTITGTARLAVDAGGMPVSRTTMSDGSYWVDALFRTTRVPTVGGLMDNRSEASRILVTGISRADMVPTDRTYLVQLVAARTGLSQPEAEQRVDQVITSAKAATDRTRKAGIVTAFLTAASLLAGCAAAWGAAQLGGLHRDQGLIWRGFARRERASRPAVSPRI